MNLQKSDAGHTVAPRIAFSTRIFGLCVSELLLLSRQLSTAGFQVNINIVIDIIMSGGVEQIVEFVKIIKYPIVAEKLGYRFAGQVAVLLIAFRAEYGKGHFFAHSLTPLHIREADRSCLFLLLK